jgi:UDP-N-acetylmuramyl pentapeptide synthase
MMNRELQAVEETKVGQTVTELSSSFIDGNDFSNVAETGASAALVSDSPRAMNSLRGLSLLQVQDTLTKLHILAPSYRQLMPPRPFSASNQKTLSNLPSPIFGGDELLLDVAETGASAALVSDSPRAMNSLRGLSLLQVQDTLTKLHTLAPSYRQLMPLRPEWN